MSEPQALTPEADAHPLGARLEVATKQVRGGGLDPLELFRRWTAPGQPGFLLESGAGSGAAARFSYVGFRPRLLPASEADPLRPLVEATAEPLPEGAPPLLGGAVGFLGYESARAFERLPAAAGAGPDFPVAGFLRPEGLAIFDQAAGTLDLVASAEPGEAAGALGARLAAMEAALEAAPPGSPPLGPALQGDGEWTANVTQPEYEAMVRAGKEHILAGDIFQVVLSQRWEKPLHASPARVYAALRRLNPSPYMFLLAWSEARSLIGTSPELLVRVAGDRVETRPLAGTRPRGTDAEADARLEAELRADPKERAEHVMLVDLGRNDVGRVAAPATVQVEKLLQVERYSHVMHLSSTVAGRLRAGCTPVDALRAAFPAGTVSGAPKIRAMQLIAELEPERRGPYAGAVGYAGPGLLDFAITLRTIVVAGGRAYVQAGAGVVADSDPEREYGETLAKAGAMFQAVREAEAR